MKPFKYIVAFLFLTACAVPEPLVKLNPSTIENQDYWNLGEQFVFHNDKNVWYDCAFNRMDNNTIVYDVKITNMSDSAILVDPISFIQRVYIVDSVMYAYDNATDPEWVLSFLALDERKAVAAGKNANTLALCSAVLTVGATVAVAVSDNKKEDKEKAIEAIGDVNQIVQVSSESVAESADIRAQDNWTVRKSLEECFLRKTTLPKGFYIEGEVHFPYYKKAKWYDVVLTSENTKATFLFKQRLIYPVYNNVPQQRSAE